MKKAFECVVITPIKETNNQFEYEIAGRCFADIKVGDTFFLHPDVFVELNKIVTYGHSVQELSEWMTGKLFVTTKIPISYQDRDFQYLTFLE